jgi:hypothetical protein
MARKKPLSPGLELHRDFKRKYSRLSQVEKDECVRKFDEEHEKIRDPDCLPVMSDAARKRLCDRLLYLSNLAERRRRAKKKTETNRYRDEQIRLESTRYAGTLTPQQQATKYGLSIKTIYRILGTPPVA